MTTVTRDPERLPTRVDPSVAPYAAFPLHPQPSFYEAMEVVLLREDGPRTITHTKVEAMLARPTTHAAFCAGLQIRTPRLPDTTMVGLQTWIDWQRTRDPLAHELPEQIAFAERRAIERAREQRAAQEEAEAKAALRLVKPLPTDPTPAERKAADPSKTRKPPAAKKAVPRKPGKP